ncbi:hypothetical protein DL546_004878 [Coniochaeta pulveracea]|uniref:Uncharacterized protein n=1 Tax=Coniochaeta pulveracea TaxID=177199 RepID=A0A420Y310_9PEZI|nr:hypothetical protein DL546_004878 [Coniochaeta pulveracea]
MESISLGSFSHTGSSGRSEAVLSKSDSALEEEEEVDNALAVGQENYDASDEGEEDDDALAREEEDVEALKVAEHGTTKKEPVEALVRDDAGLDESGESFASAAEWQA